MTAITIVTLVTGDYHFGAAALINSLAASGFDGSVLVAHDKPLPWELSREARVSFRSFAKPTRWEANLKAEIILAEDNGNYCYVDADCIAGPSFVGTIASEVLSRPIFCAEGLIGGDDVRSHAWRSDLALTDRFGPSGGLIVYINAGMFAVQLPRDVQLLTAWQDLMERALPGRGDMFKTTNYMMADQDCLNAVLQAGTMPFSTFGPPDIWYRALPHNPFHHVGSGRDVLLFHCTGGAKPWRLAKVPASKPDVYDGLFRRFTFEETPWVRTRARLPAAIRGWLDDGLHHRIARRVRNLF
jgi:hypothetical protein